MGVSRRVDCDAAVPFFARASELDGPGEGTVRGQLGDVAESVALETGVLAKDAEYDGVRSVKLDYCIYANKRHLPYGRG